MMKWKRWFALSMNSNSQPLVSVIIPAYNHERFVQDTIRSIMMQTYQNIELLVVDDGSKDSTWQKIQELQAECERRFVRVHFETKENEGTCKTLNKLLSLSEGKYVYVIASDDVAKSTAVEKEVYFLESHDDYALVVGDDEFIDDDGNQIGWDEYQNATSLDKAVYKSFASYLQMIKKMNFNTDYFGTYASLYFGNYIPNGYMIRKSIFDKIGYFTPDAPLEDYWMMLQISKYAKMKYIDEILFSYRWHSNNTVKERDYLINITKKTLEYEANLIKKMDFSDTLSNVKNISQNGVCYKKIGIPFLFQVLTYRHILFKIKVVKFFGLTIFRLKKNYG